MTAIDPSQADEEPDNDRRPIPNFDPGPDVDYLDAISRGAFDHDPPADDDTPPAVTTDDEQTAPAGEPRPTPTSLRDELDQALVTGPAVLTLPKPRPLVDGLLNLDSFAVTYGRPGSAKSFLALDLALHVAAGNWWHRHEVHQGPVLYVAAEGQSGLSARAEAWRIYNRTAIPDAITWLTRPANLLNAQAAGALADIAHDLGAVLVIIDTLNRSMAGGDENSSKDMGAAIAACDRIRRATGACVNLVHHSGKDTSQGARGHSSLLGAVDTELEVKKTDNIILLSTSKQKEAPETARPHRFTLVPAGDSAAIAPHTSRTEDGSELTANGRICLDALDRVAGPTGASTTVWRDAAIDAGASRTQAYEQIKRLAELRLTANIGTDKRPAWTLTDTARHLEDDPE